MRLLLTILTAASLAAHVCLGCCWHHAHAASGVEATAVAGDALATITRMAALAAIPPGTGPHEGDGDGDRPCDQSPCDEGRCVFAAGYAVVKCPAPDDQPSGVLAVLPHPALDGVAQPAVRHQVSAAHDLPPPVPLHLAKRVLLI